jgi:hypothetical protein
MFGIDLFKPRRRLEVENLFLRHQLSIALERAPPRLRLRGSDRALLVWMTRLWPSLLNVTRVVQPETILRWHRAGFSAFWRWKSRKWAGRPKIDRGLRLHLILPQRFFAHQQRGTGDRHMHTARTRFIPSSILNLFDSCAWPIAPTTTVAANAPREPVDITSRLRRLWS